MKQLKGICLRAISLWQDLVASLIAIVAIVAMGIGVLLLALSMVLCGEYNRAREFVVDAKEAVFNR